MAEAKFSDLVGKTLVSIAPSRDELFFVTDECECYKMYHQQDCCESVTFVDICGVLTDLIGSPILLAEEVAYVDCAPNSEYTAESYTWTFYNIATIKGSVTIRWYGTSNGYYSERVDFCRL